METDPIPVESGKKREDEDESQENMEEVEIAEATGVLEKPITGSAAPKERKDFSKEVEEHLPVFENMAKEGKLVEAIDGLLALEKKTRNGQDAFSTSKVACAIVQLSFDAKNLETLNESLTLLAKRRGQLKLVIQELVRKAMQFIDKLEEEEQQIKLIHTLREITEGKIFVEIERAQLTRKLAGMKEANGQIDEAAEILQEVQVETFGQMKNEDKVDYILEQVRLCLAKKDFIRARIIGNKINTKLLLKDEFQELKLRYYELMIEYFSEQDDFLSVCKSYNSIYNTKCIQDDKEQWTSVLKLAVAFVVLAKYDNEQSDLKHRIFKDKKLYDVPTFRSLLKAFVTVELIDWGKLQDTYKEELNKLQPFIDNREKLWEELRYRVVEHNIRVVATYYECITMERMCQLLGMPEEKTEKFISELVSGGSIFARIDRPQGTISFAGPKEASAILNDWSHDVSKMLEIIEKTCHLIQREQMVHGKKGRR